MKRLVSGFSYNGIIRIALLSFMLSAIINLFGVPSEFRECPIDFTYRAIPLSLTGKIGSKYAFTYTISLDRRRVREYDKQRKYVLYSDFLSQSKNYGSFRTVSSDIQNGQSFTYSQFPVTGHLKIEYFGGMGAPFFFVNVVGLPVGVDPGDPFPVGIGDIRNQQQSSFTMVLPEGGILEVPWAMMRNLYWNYGGQCIPQILLIMIGIIELIHFIKRFLRSKRIKAGGNNRYFML